MGFKLGKLIGSLAGGAIKSVTGGAIRPSFVRSGTALATLKGGNLPTSTAGKNGVTCPPGTACSGSSLGSLCLGKCDPIPGGMGVQGMPGGLTPMAYAAYCAAAVGPGQMRLMPSPCRGYHWNESNYATGLGSGQCQVVPRGSKLVRNRSINPANAQAARRAVRRLVGTHRLLVSIEKSIAPLARRVHGGGGSRGKRAPKSCGCKGKCSC